MPLGTEYSFTANSSNLLTGLTVKRGMEGVIYTVDYSEHVIIGDLAMATHINLVSHIDDSNLTIQTSLTPERIELNGSYNDAPPSFKEYTRIPGDMLLMQLSNEF